MLISCFFAEECFDEYFVICVAATEKFNKGNVIILENKKNGHLAMMLRRYRESNALTQEFVASQLNVSRSTYSYYEIGKTEPNLKSLSILAKMFGIGVEDFLPEERGTVLHDGNSRQNSVAVPTAIGNLTPEERQLVAMYRLANNKEKRKVVSDLQKNKE